jgi:cytochrome P450
MRNPTGFLLDALEWPGEVAEVRIGRRAIVLLKHPDLIQQLLVADATRTEKGRTLERALFFRFLGDGLLNSKGESHRRQRRLILPAFHRQRLAGYAEAMVDTARATAETWQDGQTRDIGEDMMALTLSVVGRALCSTGVGGAAPEITKAFSRLTENVNRMLFPGARWLLRSPLPFARRVRDAERMLDETVYALIRERRSRAEDTGDLLSMLLLAEDAERPGERLADVEVRDQVMTLIFAGHETIANVLTWAWWLIAQHPHVESALHHELDTVLGTRAPSFEDVPKLCYTEKIVHEVLRLFPPVWALGRRAIAPLNFNGHVVQPGSLVVASQWASHRDPRWFPEPETFRPERWTQSFQTSLPRFAYFPFGGGPRSCIGEHFAWMELALVLATIAQRWRLGVTDTTSAVKPEARITLHPDRPVLLHLERRGLSSDHVGSRA